MLKMLLDPDGYPAEESLAAIKDWRPAEGQSYESETRAVFEAIRSVWMFADWGWHSVECLDDCTDTPCLRLAISTGGWSGNEDLIQAMRENYLLWSFTWEQSRRGGHYLFRLPLTKAEVPQS